MLIWLVRIVWCKFGWWEIIIFWFFWNKFLDWNFLFATNLTNFCQLRSRLFRYQIKLKFLKATSWRWKGLSCFTRGFFMPKPRFWFEVNPGLGSKLTYFNLISWLSLQNLWRLLTSFNRKHGRRLNYWLCVRFFTIVSEYWEGDVDLQTFCWNQFWLTKLLILSRNFVVVSNLVEILLLNQLVVEFNCASLRIDWYCLNRVCNHLVVVLNTRVLSCIK